MRQYPDDKITVIVLRNVNVNGPPPEQIAHQLAAVARGDAVRLSSERKEITLDPKVSSRYPGAYQLAQGPAMLIALEGDHLVSKLGNQPPVPIFPESETMFFAKVVDAQIEFPKVDAEGKASQLTLHQGGRDITASGWTTPRLSAWRMPPRRSPKGSRTRRPRRAAKPRCAS